MSGKHVPVLLTETLEALHLTSGATIVDATFGGGGHSSAIAEKLGPQGRIWAFDQDPLSATYAAEALLKYPQITLVRNNFSQLRPELLARGVTAVDAVLFDLGVSSFQLDDPARGFSWKYEAPLDMRMDPTKGITAQELLATADVEELTRIITDYGEERTARFIATAVVQSRKLQPLKTSLQLKELVQSTVRGSYEYRTSAVARVFQALRIAVNAELTILPQALYDAVTMLKPGGRIAVITFHSLEDRIAKYVLRMLAGKQPAVYGLPEQHLLELVSGKAIKPLYTEVQKNVRARSAKLRVGERCA